MDLLPNEIFIYIGRYLDIQSLGRFMISSSRIYKICRQYLYKRKVLTLKGEWGLYGSHHACITLFEEKYIHIEQEVNSVEDGLLQNMKIRNGRHKGFFRLSKLIEISDINQVNLLFEGIRKINKAKLDHTLETFKKVEADFESFKIEGDFIIATEFLNKLLILESTKRLDRYNILDKSVQKMISRFLNQILVKALDKTIDQSP